MNVIINDPFTWLAGLLVNWLSTFMPADAVNITMAVLRAAFLGIFALVMFMVMTWIERKGVARIQNRIGPNLAGPWGIFQPLADGVKALTKEDITPDHADRVVYNIAPILSAVAAMIVFAAIPFGPGLIGTDMSIGIFYILAVSGMSVLAILLAGWSSNNKYALLGGFRVVAQLVSYEVPHVLSIVAPVMLAGSLSLVTIVEKQSVWFIIILPASAVIVMLSGMAEVGRSPFDLLDAESEIIAGHHIEYSGMKFALFFLAEYIHAFAVSCIVTALFLGGWRGPNIAGVTVPWLWFFVKAILIFNIMVWARGTLPRLRIDQLMAFNWKFLVPLSLANLIVVPLADRLAQGLGLSFGSWPWALVMLAFNVAMIWVAFALVGAAGQRARIAAEAPAEAPAEPHDESGHGDEHELGHGADAARAPAAVGAH
jgi:NADH-quinone oxidoreductase subunit H